MFSGDISIKDVIVGFSGSIDTAAWVILLLIFELETYIIDDEKLKGGLKFSLKVISGLCYAFIFYSFYGYLKKYFWFSNFQTLSDTVLLCQHVGKSWLLALDEFTSITAENCSVLTSSSQLYIFSDNTILSDLESINIAKRVALIDIFNSLAWLIIVIVLEIEVWLQLKNKLVGRAKHINTFFKIIAYSILIIAAISWGISGEYLDTWDALLWILAFAFIEMNMFKWQKEIEEETEKKETY